MEARRQPSRRVRDEANVRKNEEAEVKTTKKRTTPEAKETSMKKQKKTKGEENKVATIKKGVKAASNTKVDESSVDEDSNEEPAPKVKKATSKNKTTDDVPVAKASKGKATDPRRSRSVEPATANDAKKKNAKKEDAIDEEPVPIQKKGRGKKAAAVEPEMVEEEEPKANGRGKRGSPSDADAGEAPPVKKGRGGKKAEAVEVEPSNEDKEPAKEVPVAKKGRGAKKTAAKDEEASETKESTKEDSDDNEEPADKEDGKTEKKLMNNVDTNYNEIDFGIKEKFNFKISSWNVAGLRALVKKNPDYFEKENADIICLNEIKCGSLKEVPDEYKPEGYHAFWNMEKGAGGVGLLSKVEPIQVTFDLPDSDFSNEKRIITAEFEKFFVVSVYVVNAGRGLKTLEKRLEWNEIFDTYVKELDKKKPVIIAGDMNVSHQEIDLANPKNNKKNAGFTQEERDGLTKLLSLGFVDTFRHFYPELTGAYTFWSYMGNARSKNVGWRLDYFLVSQRFMKHVKDNVIRSTVMGSDHSPIVLFLNM